MIQIAFKDQGPLSLDQGRTIAELIQLYPSLMRSTPLAAKVNDRSVDMSYVLQEGDQLALFSFDDPEGREVFWHTSAHVLAQAILRLWPEAQPTIGPPIQEGFYYDFARLKITEEDFAAIEAEMKRIVHSRYMTTRHVLADKASARAAFASNPYKLELIDNLPEGEPITAYLQGEFFDLCRGPHLPSLAPITSIKLLKTAGAYWRGDKDREMLTRVYAISFPSEGELQAYLQRQEEAKKRDHKVLGPQLGLFSLHEEAPGLPFIHPKGVIVWNKLLDFWRDLHRGAGYVEIKTPTLMTRELWETSGHWQNYRSNMYTTTIEERDFAIKPMNCPGAIVYYRSHHHSYRELPLRVAEVGLVHRYEASGALSGLFRVRGFHQDDAHLFLRPQDIQEEVARVLELVSRVYTTFGLSYHIELSTRPEKDTIGSDEQWESATQGLEQALKQLGLTYKINPGDGAFYGPKIDIHIRDAIGRTWQCATIQLDMALPERFDLHYVDVDGARKQPVLIHRVILGSIERFLGILIEHFKGRLPLWLSPVQVRLLPVADRHVARCEEIKRRLQGYEVDIDLSHESLSKKVRQGQLEQVNYLITVGDKEMGDHPLPVRVRDHQRVVELTLESFLQSLRAEEEGKHLLSPL